MYTEFYGLTDKPFRKTPDPAFFFPSAGHAEALERLRYAVEEREVMVLTGEVGSGKTLLSRALIDGLDDTYRVALLINPVLTPAGFLRTLALRLGATKPRHYKADLIEQVSDLLFELYEQECVAVIIIDEAHLIPSRATFEEIRLLTNFQMDTENILSIILMGQPDLAHRLRRPPYTALAQRVGLVYDLPPLTREETGAYVIHRVGVVGRTKPLFEEEAVDLLWHVSRGLPRKINNLAGTALLEGFGRDASVISRALIADAATDLGMLDPVAIPSETPVPKKVSRSRSGRPKKGALQETHAAA